MAARSGNCSIISRVAKATSRRIVLLFGAGREGLASVGVFYAAKTHCGMALTG
jgi:hypothetical protein